jgi:hypothetical protein
MKDLAEDLVTVEQRRIAHDLSNQIMVVQGNLDLLRMKLERGERPGAIWSRVGRRQRCRTLGTAPRSVERPREFRDLHSRSQFRPISSPEFSRAEGFSHA